MLPEFYRHFFLLLTLVFLASSGQASEQTRSPVVLNCQGECLLNIDQDWYFLWNEAGDIRATSSHDWHYIDRIRPWTSIEAQGAEPLPSFGFGTYRFDFKGLRPRKDGYAIEIGSINSAYRASLFPIFEKEKRQLAQGGDFRPNATMIPSRQSSRLFFEPQSVDEHWVLVIEVANYQTFKGGIWAPPLLGTRSHMERYWLIRFGTDLFCLGATAFVCLYNFFMFAQRRTDYASLSLGFAAIFGILRILSTSEVFHFLFPIPTNTMFRFHVSLTYITVLLPVVFLTRFFFYSFADQFAPRFVNGMTIYSFALSLAASLLPLHIVTRYLLIFQLSMVPLALYVIFCISRAIRSQTIGIWESLFGLAFIFSTILYDILVSIGYLSPPFYSQFGVVVFMLMQSQVVAKRFSIAFATAEHLKSKLGFEVEAKTSQIRTIMDNVPQGLCLIDKDLKIHGHYAKYLETLLQKNLSQSTSILDLLFKNSYFDAETIAVIKSCLEFSFHDDALNWEFNRIHLPNEIALEDENGTKTLEVFWHPIFNSEHILEYILLSIRDITEYRQLQETAKIRTYELHLITELLQTERRLLIMFWNEARIHLRKMTDDIQRNLDYSELQKRLLVPLHTLKGSSRSLHLASLTKLVHDAETKVLEINRGSQEEIAEIAQDIARIAQVLDDYQNIFDKKLILQTHSKQYFSESDRQRLCDLLLSLPASKTIRELLNKYFLRTAQQICDDFTPEINSLSAELGKPSPSIRYTGLEIWIRSDYEAIFRQILRHLIRNSLDHGLESSEERIAQKKSVNGSIQIEINRIENEYRLIYADDGRGLDYERIQIKAKKHGLPLDVDLATLSSYVFEAGFSTASSLSEISGRGVGMGAAKQLLSEIGGRISVVPESLYEGNIRFQVHLFFPLSFFIEEPDIDRLSPQTASA